MQAAHMSSTRGTISSAEAPRLRRALTLWNLVIIGIIMIQPIAPMGIYGVISNKAQGHVVSTILIAMVAMLFTAISYGRMARVYPSAGSAYTYVGQEIHPALGYITGWSMVMDYVLNPLICVAICSKLTMNILPIFPFYVWVLFFATFFTVLNLRGIKTSAQFNEWLCAGMMVVVVIFFGAVIRYLWGLKTYGPGFFSQPFYNPETFNISRLFAGTSVAVLTYIGFDGISTLSEEAENPRRNILLATVLVCVITGVLSSLEVYGAQLVWGSQPFPSDKVESAFVLISEKAGGIILYHVMNFTILIASIGSGMGTQLAAGRLLYGMGRGNALPKSFFGAIEPKRRIPRNNIIAVGVFALAGSSLLELLAGKLGGGAYEIGAQALNFGAFIAFMGVNASAIACWIKSEAEQRRANDSSHSVRGFPARIFIYLLPPVAGFVICGYIWWKLSIPAKIVGAIWMAAGISYGAIKTKGFRSELINFDMPPEE
jgi:amino acid transporter